jgi:hypothetical protein
MLAEVLLSPPQVGEWVLLWRRKTYLEPTNLRFQARFGPIAPLGSWRNR